MLTHAFSADSLSHSLWHYAYRSSDAAAAAAKRARAPQSLAGLGFSGNFPAREALSPRLRSRAHRRGGQVGLPRPDPRRRSCQGAPLRRFAAGAGRAVLFDFAVTLAPTERRRLHAPTGFSIQS